jgi:23S rRNA (cytidine1920-2'-O)/16S rRNA (cytidine1409-2'-O)-methyltransferase
MRLDIYLQQQQFFPSRVKANEAIHQAKVLVNGIIITKSAYILQPQDIIQILPNDVLKYVSAGGFKLEKALQDFKLDLKDKTVLDIGSSTGGFTDCALQHGASVVYAVDGGSNQLHSSLIAHPQVQVYEHTPIQQFNVPNLVDVVVMDVSFTSQTFIYPILPKLLKPQGIFLSLIKPQFELGAKVSISNGIIKDPKLHLQVWSKIAKTCAQHNLYIHNITTTPMHKKKNIEYFALFQFIPNTINWNYNKIIEQAFTKYKS